MTVKRIPEGNNLLILALLRKIHDGNHTSWKRAQTDDMPVQHTTIALPACEYWCNLLVDCARLRGVKSLPRDQISKSHMERITTGQEAYQNHRLRNRPGQVLGKTLLQGC